MAKVASLERKLAATADTEALLHAANKELSQLKQQLAERSSSTAASTANQTSGGAAEGLGLMSDLQELRRQLAAAEEARLNHAKLESAHRSLEGQLHEWVALFASEASTELQLTSEGLPPPSAPAALRATLTKLRSENGAMVKQTGSMQGMLHEAEAARATAAREAASSSAEATSARQEAASAMEAARRAEWKATELGVKVRVAQRDPRG